MCSIEEDLFISFLCLRATGVYACLPMFIYPLGEGKEGGIQLHSPLKRMEGMQCACMCSYKCA